MSHKQRLHYSDVYDSLSEDEEACTNFQESSTSEHIKITKEMIANKFVIVQFQSKKNLRHYIGLVTNIDCSVMDCEVKFLKKKSGSLKEFCFPEKDDISLVELRDIVKILHNPLINRRQNYVFDADFSFFKNIF